MNIISKVSILLYCKPNDSFLYRWQMGSPADEAPLRKAHCLLGRIVEGLSGKSRTFERNVKAAPGPTPSQALLSWEKPRFSLPSPFPLWQKPTVQLERCSWRKGKFSSTRVCYGAALSKCGHDHYEAKWKSTKQQQTLSPKLQVYGIHSILYMFVQKCAHEKYTRLFKHNEAFVLVKGWYTRKPQAGWLINTETYFPQFWRLGVWAQGASMVRFSGKPSSRVWTAIFLSYPSMAERRRELSGVSIIRARIPFMRTPFSWPT